jgi:hypothetical protein
MTQLCIDSRNSIIRADKAETRTTKSRLWATALLLAFSTTSALATPALQITGMAKAGEVEFDFPNSAKDIFVTGYDHVKLSFDFDYDSDADTNQSDWSQQVWAGAFGGEAKRVEDENGSLNPFDPANLYRSADEVVLYCLDIFNDLKYKGGFSKYIVQELDNKSTTATTTSTEDDNNIIGNVDNVLNFLGALNDVLAETEYWVEVGMGGHYTDYAGTTYYDGTDGTDGDKKDGWVNAGLYGFGERNWLNPANSIISGAIQVGIWESLYDYDNILDIEKGRFSVTGLHSEGESLLSSTFERMDTSDSLNSDLVLLFQPINGGQTLIGDPDANEVPIPGTLVLMLGGLLMLGRLRWSRNKT